MKESGLEIVVPLTGCGCTDTPTESNIEATEGEGALRLGFSSSLEELLPVNTLSLVDSSFRPRFSSAILVLSQHKYFYVAKAV